MRAGITSDKAKKGEVGAWEQVQAKVASRSSQGLIEARQQSAPSHDLEVKSGKQARKGRA